MTDPQSAMAYVGVNPCGCAVAIVVDEPRYAAATAKDIGRWVMDGLTIERMTVREGVERIRTRKDCCRKSPEPEARPAALLTAGQMELMVG